MAAFALRNGTCGIAAQINVTPLVDVMLVLLVIFMLAVPLTTQHLPLINAPACRENCPTPREPVRLAIKRTGELYWNGAAISRGALLANLGALGQQQLPQTLEIHAEANARYALVTDVLAAAHSAAVHEISIAPTRD
ncbi:MAG TPA: biopolymer transporter ExbD [Rudaea sp.]|jgi:biopolymer transport protein ExbD